ncbi:MAG: TapB family protein [Methanobacteriota archaeon]
MASIRGAVGLLLAVGLLAGVTGPVAAVDAPRLAVGDRWTYFTDTATTDGFRLVGTATFAIDSRDIVVVSGQALDVFRVEVGGSGNASGRVEFEGNVYRLSGTWTLAGEELLEVDGLKVVSSYVRLVASGRTQPLNLALTIRVENTTTFEILDDAWRFPVHAGDVGTLTERLNTSEDILARAGLSEERSSSNATVVRTLRYRAEADERLSVPAGTFDTIRINETTQDGRYTHLYYAPMVGNNVRSESYNATGERIGSTGLASYRYQVLELPGLAWPTLLAAGLVVVGIAVPVAVLFVRRRSRMRLRSLRPPPGPS